MDNAGERNFSLTNTAFFFFFLCRRILVCYGWNLENISEKTICIRHNRGYSGCRRSTRLHDARVSFSSRRFSFAVRAIGYANSFVKLTHLIDKCVVLFFFFFLHLLPQVCRDDVLRTYGVYFFFFSPSGFPFRWFTFSI